MGRIAHLPTYDNTPSQVFGHILDRFVGKKDFLQSSTEHLEYLESL